MLNTKKKNRIIYKMPEEERFLDIMTTSGISKDKSIKKTNKM